MKTFTFLKKNFQYSASLLFLLATIAAGELNAQSNQPIGCNGQFFISHGSQGTATSTTSLQKLTFSGSTITSSPFNANPTGIGFNSLGLNPVDGYMYGLRYPVSGDRVRLVRIGNGTPNNVVDLGEVSNGGGNLNNGEQSYAGCFDAAGNFYFFTENHELFRISGNNFPATSLTATYLGTSSPGGTGTNFFVDIAIDPVTGTMYGVTYNRRLHTINTANANATFIGTHAGTQYIAALFFDEVGNLFGYRQDGTFQKIDKATAALQQVGTAPSYTYADGCSCSFGRVFHDLDAPNAICPTAQNKNPEFDIIVSVTNQTSSQQTGLTYELEIPGNRFSFIETPAVIAQRLFDAGLIPANNPALITISSANTGTDNKIVVTSFRTGGVNTTIDFTLKLKLVTLGGTYNPVPLQSKISGLSAILGLEDLSNDPGTAAPDDPALVDFCGGITLPVRLLNFSGAFQNNATALNWQVDNQDKFSHYEIERSSNGSNYTNVASKSALPGSGKLTYQHSDDLSGADATGNIFYYRLKMVDLDGRYSYSNVVLIRRDQKAVAGLLISPNPVVNANMLTIRLSVSGNSAAQVKIFDLSGRIMHQQQNMLTEGTNSISVNDLSRLQPGTYMVQVVIGGEVLNSKFTIVR